jgi:PKD repeat protein
MKLTGLTLVAFISLLLLLGCEKDEEEKKEKVNHAPIANLYADVTSGDRPLTVKFDASGSTDQDGDVLSYLWDFGDGKTSTSISVSKYYGTIGTYEVKLKVTDAKGLSDDASTTIIVNKPPNLFPVTEGAQWVYRVKSTDTENGEVSGYEEGTTYLVVTEIDLQYENIDFITLRVTGKQYYNERLLGDYIYLSHTPGEELSILHPSGDSYVTMIDLDKTSWNNFAMFFSQKSSQEVTLSTASVTIGLGTFQAYRVKYQNDNWGEQYVTERYDVTEEEYVNPQIGLLYRKTSRYAAFLDCFTCPVYGGSDEIELIGYYIPQEGGGTLQGGTGYNPNNPYGGDLGLLTIWNSVDIGYTDVYLGDYAGMIQNYWPGGLSCDQYKALNVFRPTGLYWMTADSPKGYHWATTVTFSEGVCNTIELTINKKSAGDGYQIEASQPFSVLGF